MKTAYFDQLEPDKDDEILRKHIAEGNVPEKCLLGGATVSKLRDNATDPCTVCPCDRAKCGGRPAKADLGLVDTKGLQRDSSAYRRILRSSAVRQLQTLTADHDPPP